MGHSHRILITTIYIVLFWILLPGILFGSGFLLDRGLAAELPLPSICVPIGIAVVIVAAVMLVTAIVQFRRFGRELPISALPPDTLIQKGLFAAWRHPVYLFFFLLMVGAALVLRSGGLIFIILPVFALLIGVYITVEERVLIKRFGQSYIGYRERTPLLIPRLDYMIIPPIWLLSRWLFRFRVLHRERIPERSPFFLVAAHRNYLDPFFILAALGRRINYVSTIELFRRPLSAFLFGKLGTIPKTRYRSDILTVRGIVRILHRNGIVGIFPEGERSWTGVTDSWKPEVLRLFKAFPEVPILPVRIEGNYHIWPRWAHNIRRAQLEVTFMDPVTVHDDFSLAQLETILRDRIEPEDSTAVHRKRSRIHGIGKLIYRCPVCRSFSSIRESGPASATCSSCGHDFELLPDYTFEYRIDGTEVRRSLGEVYDGIRINATDLDTLEDDDTVRRQPAGYGSVTVYKEKEIRMVPLFAGSLKVTDSALVCRNSGQMLTLLLDDLRSVTIEGNNRLQVYDGVGNTLYQFTFLEESALRWQDHLIEAIRRRSGFEPNRR